MNARHLARLGLAVALTAAGCTSSDADSAASGDSTASETVGAATSDAGVADVATTSTSDTSTAATTTTAATTSTTTTTSTTIAPTTTVAPAVEAVSAFCLTMAEEGFETRRTALAELADLYAQTGATGDARAAAVAECGPLVERIDAANTIIARSDSLTEDPETGEDRVAAITLDDFTCEFGRWGLTVTNKLDFAVGLQFELQLTENDGTPRYSGNRPIVIWSIEPGASVAVDGSFVEVAGRGFACDVSGEPFVADPSDIDASNGDAMRPELTGDDPAVWFPALFSLSETAKTAEDPDAMADVEDVRSLSYTDVIEAARAGEGGRPSGPITVCEAGRDQPDPDHIAFVYVEDRPEYTFEGDDGPEVVPAGIDVRHGAFRRGADGQWRWLVTANDFTPAIGDGCDGVAAVSGL